MDYASLEDFIKNKMRMTHIYQPIMLKALIESKENTLTTTEIAKKFLNKDESQIKYYEKIVKRWPHDTLVRRHQIVKYKGKNIYALELDDISDAQKQRLIELCDLRLNEFVDKDPWIKKFRELDARSISGSIRYDILAKAKGRCAACGIERSKALLHVDHIRPHSMGGPTVPGNLQVLCVKCNTAKRNRDDTDFLLWEKCMPFRKPDCKLCDPNNQITSNQLACAIYDQNTESEMDSLVMPKRHVGKFDDMIPAERNLCMDLVYDIQRKIRANDSSITGFRTSFDSDHSKHYHILVAPVR